MCGICGKLNYAGDQHVDPELIQQMMDTMAHRGPDGEGKYVDGPIGLGHRRLSIIDLNTGAQPISNEDDTVWIVFNGEIYNYRELRQELLNKGHSFKTSGDTEVILHLYEEYGTECLKRLRGMFAFAIWDAKKRRLFLARDRVGIKPLYYAQTPAAFFFASELKAILADAGFERKTNLRAIRKFLAFGYVPGPETLFQNILKLLPGHYLVVENGKTSCRQYWDLQFTQERASVSFEEAAEELEALLRDSVKSHMIADVPVGVLLSGGMDSSAVLNFAVRQTDKRVQTFTIGFSGSGVIDERPYARLTAKHFGTTHHETTISAQKFWEFLPAYVKHMEEPICEPPAVALYYLTQLVRKHVKVVLSGEGGDEAFGGYSTYPNLMRLQSVGNLLGPFARPCGTLAHWGGDLTGNSRLRRYGQALGRPLAFHYFSRTSGPSDYFNRSATALLAGDLLDHHDDDSPEEYVRSLTDNVKSQALLNRMLYVDTKTWLPDDLLVKADKMTMANSVELRVPLLDHPVLEFAASLPPDFKVHKGATKRLLKSTFAKALPREVLERKKAGFPVPYEHWLRNEMRGPVQDVLLGAQFNGRGYFRRDAIEILVERFVTTGSGAKEIFSLLLLEFWHREFVYPNKCLPLVLG